MSGTCRSCGAQTAETDRFCPGCGLSLEDKAVRSRKTRRTVLIVVVVLAGLLAYVGWLAYGKITGALAVVREPVNTYLDHLAHKRLKEAYAMTSSTFQLSVSPEEYAGYLQNHPYLTNIAQRSFDGYGWDNGIASVSGKLTAIDGSVTPIKFKLIKEKDTWRIMSAGLDVDEGGKKKKDDETATQAGEKLSQ